MQHTGDAARHEAGDICDNEGPQRHPGGISHPFWREGPQNADQEPHRAEVGKPAHSVGGHHFRSGLRKVFNEFI